MGLGLGTTDLSKVYLGSTEISKIYVGSTLIYTSASSEPDVDYSVLGMTSDTNTFSDAGITGGLGGAREINGHTWIIGVTDYKLYDYTATHEDLNSISSNSKSFSLSNTAQDFAFSSDGSKIIYCANGSVFRHRDLGTAWDITTLGSIIDTVTFPGSTTTESRGMVMKPDGTRIFVLDNGTSKIYQYDFTSSNEPTSITYSSIELDISSEGTNNKAIEMSPDGLTLVWADASNDYIYQYNLSSSWDLNSAVYSGSLDINPPVSVPAGIYYNESGSKLILVDGGDEVMDQYSLNN